MIKLLVNLICSQLLLSQTFNKCECGVVTTYQNNVISQKHCISPLESSNRELYVSLHTSTMLTSE